MDLIIKEELIIKCEDSVDDLLLKDEGLFKVEDEILNDKIFTYKSDSINVKSENIQVEEIYIKQEKDDDSRPVLVNKEITIKKELITSNTEETIANRTSPSHSGTSLFHKNVWDNLHNLKTVKVFKCDLCTKTFPHYGRLQLHQNVHTRTQAECEICHKKIATTGIYKHMLVHNGGNPFKCEECGKCFHTAETLKFHSFLHTGEKPYECTICKKRFVRNCYLQSHINTHTGEKKFECEKCKKQFYLKYSLKRHMKSHI